MGQARPLPWVARRPSPGLRDVAPLFTSRETALHLRPERLTGLAFGGGGRTSRRRHRRSRRWRGGRGGGGGWGGRRPYGRLVRDVGGFPFVASRPPAPAPPTTPTTPTPPPPAFTAA